MQNELTLTEKQILHIALYQYYQTQKTTHLEQVTRILTNKINHAKKITVTPTNKK